MKKHTPGPWSVVEHDHAICVQTESPHKTKFGASRYASVGGFDRSDKAQLEEARANARLISAAPDLLEALRDALDLIETISPFEDDTVRKARAAITKAAAPEDKP